ncbi:hypothetical protein QO058_09350 [Bosea vestrisii]|uniref:hypothetical protein n=1 Tax=Bosea vestrisii TaxID=151416 RepID=UPI0024DFF8EC|nr:hypothetical protein [Bosea vestrisii]WID98417.1 hypothetical protein QO058_09350 [Bosea vestrisii]
MSNLSHSFVEPEPPRPESFAPSLPIEQHIVGTALATERTRGLIEQLLLLLRHAPQDTTTFARVYDDALGALLDIDDHHRAYREVRICKGQG